MAPRPPPGPPAPPRGDDLVHELTSSLAALLLGLQRLRSMQGGPEKDRALALLDRMETAVRGISALLESVRGPPSPGEQS
jgi:hypothetical protein